MRKSIIIIIAMFFVILSAYAQDRTVTVRVQLIKGSLLLKQNNEWIPLAVGDQLLKGDVIKTEKRSFSELVYANTIIIKMAENTELEIKELEPAKKTILQRIGKIWVKVQKLVGEKFEVETRFGTAGVRGTSLGSNTDPATGTDVTCEEGTVFLRTLTGEESDLKAGEQSGFDVNGRVLSPRPINENEGFENFGTDSDTGMLIDMIKGIYDLIGEIERRIAEKKPFDEQMKILYERIRMLENFAHTNAITIDELPQIKEKVRSLRVKTDSDDELSMYIEALQKINDEIDRWRNTFTLEGAGIDFKVLSLKIDSFMMWYKDTKNSIDTTMTIIAGISTPESIPLLQKYKQAMISLDSVFALSEKVKNIIIFENQLYTRMTATREKVAAFKREFEQFSAQMVSSAQWIESASGMIATGSVTQAVRYQAKQWQYFMRRYDALRSEYADYEKLIGEAKRKGVLFISGRVTQEADSMKALVTNFQVKKGCCNVTMNFGQLKQIFMILSSFLSGEGRVLLQ